MTAKKAIILLALLLALGLSAWAQGPKWVRDLPSHFLQDFAWMRLADVVPQVTDRVILPMGTVEPHGACVLGTDNHIPTHLAELLWDRLNALIAPAINHGVTGASISQFPGAITVRPEIFEEYVYDVLKHLVRTGFRNILILNGHGGNTDPVKRAMTRIHSETAAHMMVVDWWTMAFNIVHEVYGAPAQQSGHGDMEEAALVLAFNPKLVDREIYEKLGKDNIGSAGAEAGFFMLPAWATSRYPAKGLGYLDFDLAKAKAYADKKAAVIGDTFLEAVKRWEMMEGWKK